MARDRAPAPETAALTAVYARISEIPDADDADIPRKERTDGVDRQVADGIALCRRNGWPHLEPFVDNDYSASDYATKERPRYKEMMRLVRGGEVTRIVCYDVDRLYRRVKELEELISLANDGRVSIVSMHGELDLSTADGRFTARILVSMAQKSSDDTSRRIRRQRQAWREKGIAKGGRAAFGWTDPMTPAPDEVKVIEKAMKAVLAGESLNGIAKAWNEQGIPTKAGAKQWTHDTVTGVLLNPRNIGKMTHGREVHPVARAGHRRQIVGDAKWPAIVDRDIFERVTAVVESRGAHLQGIAHARAPLTGVLVCGNCGSTLTKHQTNGKPAWRCMKTLYGRGCNRIGVKAETLEARIYVVVFRYVDKAKLADLVDADDEDANRRIVDQVTAIDRKVAEYADMLDADEMDRPTFARLRQRALAKQAALTDRLARNERYTVLKPYAGKPGRLRAAWDELSVDRKRAVIVAALAPITVHASSFRGPGFDTDRVRFGELNQRAEELLAS
jgi:DNA invertase Pin-like site-specific DNA recombinase